MVDILGYVLPDGPGVHAVCGRECTDDSPCQNRVGTPGDACWIDSHRDEDPRVDGGPTSPDEVPLSDLSRRTFEYAAGAGSALGLGAAWWFGLGRFGFTILSALGAIALTLILAFAVDAYQRRAVSADGTTGQN
jgi:hypothetical protein